MDQLLIKSVFGRRTIARIFRKLIRKNTNVDPMIKLNDIEAKMYDHNVHVHLDVDLDISKEDLQMLLEKKDLI